MASLTNGESIIEEEEARSPKHLVKRFKEAVQKFFIEFCANSNIHGVRYFTERTLHWSERLWWIIAFGVSFWLFGSMIHNIWMEWNENPTNILNEKTHISMIPFPTVTICPEIKSLKHKLDISSKFHKKLKQFSNLSDIETAQLNALAHVCPYLRSFSQFTDNFANESIYEIIEDMAPNLECTIQECRWQQKEINCSEYITPTMTQSGVCFTFNAINSYEMHTDEVVTHSIIAKTNQNVSDWSMESGYKNEFTGTEYPVRVFESGRKGALELVLSSNTQDHDYLCSAHRQGFTFFLSASDDSLEAHKLLPIDNSKDILITVKPTLLTTSKQLRNYKPMQRDCFFNNERQLHFFKMYTQYNCIVECIANFTKQQCGCVRFSIPRDTTTKICGEAKIKCYRDAQTIFLSNHGSKFHQKCYCLPSCKSIEYEVEIDQVKFSVSSVKNAQINDIGYQEARLTIFFDENYIKTKRRVERYTISDFLAICGGLLGLFLGVSALSIIELIYFPTLRLFRIFYLSKAKRNEQLSKRSEIEENRVNGENLLNENFLIRAIRFFRAFFTEFCDDSNMHGVRYLSERGLHWSEKLGWMISICISLWLCSSMIHSAWIQWLEDPLTMRPTTKSMFTESIPFPTVTICPEIKTMKRKFDVTTAINSLSNLSDIEMIRLNALAHICPLLHHTITYTDNFVNDSIYNTIHDIAPNIRESMSVCKWQNNKNCSKLFTSVLTDEGLCFTFNALNSHEIYTDEMAPGMMIVKNNLNVTQWSLDNGYTNETVDGNYPLKAINKGHQNYLILILAIDSKNIDYQCRGCDNGFKLILTMPGEMLDPSRNYLRLSISNQNIVEFIIKPTFTSDGLRTYKPNQRQCFYSSDHPLRFFKIYTKSNCEAECVANFTKIECGCVKFSMPRDINTKICGGANIKCYKLARWILFTSKRGKLFHEKCNCLASCTSFEYNRKTHRTTLNQTNLEQLGLPKNLNVSLFFLKFKPNDMGTMIRKEMYTFSDFLAVCGGLLGLFLGVSFLSIIELIYYSTLRFFWTIKLKRNHSY